jgi:hypothetical protein
LMLACCPVAGMLELWTCHDSLYHDLFILHLTFLLWATLSFNKSNSRGTKSAILMQLFILAS